MQAGELELRRVFEQTTTQNVNVIKDYTTDTRELVRKLEEQVNELKMLVMSKDTEINNLKKQVSAIQQKLYSTGT